MIHVSKLKKKIFLPPKVNGFLHKKLNFKIFKIMNLSNLPVHVKAVASWLSKYSLLNLSNFFLISHFIHKCGRTVTEYINFVVNTQTGQLDIEGKALGPH